nr:aldo/keto reductase [Kibdelosporangium sp. MJ126-NF4]CEL14284.1 voltage-gated potassium channel beta subunit [Kibdelosporangium sp. MJ126-NF4]CTQ88651.1 voltage-gated potassium channel beta subunit [Kibdelosporangium sp. MJ126-NF4]
MMVPRRTIGIDGPEVSVLSLGSWHTYDRMPFRDAVTMVRQAVDHGINLFDVGYYGFAAESYTDILFGRIIQTAGVDRDDYVLSAKLWVNDYPAVPFEEQLDYLLLRVGTDRAEFAVLGDLFGLTVDFRQLVTDLQALVDKGKLGGWGVNNWSIADIRAVHDAATVAGVQPPQMVQFKYSVVRRSIADGEPFRKLVADTGITLQASDVLEGGILAGNLAPGRVIGKDPGGIQDKVPDAARRLSEIAATMDATAAQVAVAFCLRHPALTTVLFGASKPAQVMENLDAVSLAEQCGDDIRAAVDELWLDRDVVSPWGIA